MNVDLNTSAPKAFSKKSLRHWNATAVYMALITLSGLMISALIQLWCSFPIITSFANLASDDKQIEILGESRLQLAEFYKLRQRFLERDINDCLQHHEVVSSCELPLVVSRTKLEVIPESLLLATELGRPHIEWKDELVCYVYDGKDWWEFQWNIRQIKPLVGEIASALTTRDHLSLVIHELKRSLLWGLVGAAAIGLLVSAWMLLLLTRKIRRRFQTLQGYIRSLAQRSVHTVPGILSDSSEMGILAKEVHAMALERAAAEKKAIDAERMSVWQTMAKKVAHEIKNPLTPMSLVGEQLAQISLNMRSDSKSEAEADVIREAARIIQEETASLNRMVREFTAFARLPKPHLNPLDLSIVIQDFIKRNAASDGPKMEYIGHGHAWARVDGPMIHQILHNLINNAALAKAPEQVTVKIKIKEDARSSYWLIEVSDDGPGIPLALQPHVFEAYVTSRSTGEREKGMGLGLTISRQIALDHGGDLSLIATGSSGTVMQLKIPVWREGQKEIISKIKRAPGGFAS